MPKHAPLPSFSVLIELYLADCEAQNYSPSTLKWYREKLESYLYEDISLAHVHHYLARLRERNLSSFTIRGSAQVLKGFGTWLVEEQHLKSSPLAGMKLPKTETRIPRVLDKEEREKLLRTPSIRTICGIRDCALLHLMLDTGLRVGEVATLLHADVDLRGMQCKVLGKGRKERYVYFGRRTLRALQRWWSVRPEGSPYEFTSDEGKELRRDAVEHLIGRVAKSAGLKFRPHDLRHTFGVSFMQAGGDSLILQKLLGHTTLNTTLIYARMGKDDVRDGYISPL